MTSTLPSDAEFQALQQKLVPLWRSIDHINADPQTIVVLWAPLEIADKHRLSSIAFPALGTGAAGLGATHSADAMPKTLVQHLKAGNSTLEKVVFVLYQDEAHKAFTDTLKKLTGVS